MFLNFEFQKEGGKEEWWKVNLLSCCVFQFPRSAGQKVKGGNDRFSVEEVLWSQNGTIKG